MINKIIEIFLSLTRPYGMKFSSMSSCISFEYVIQVLFSSSRHTYCKNLNETRDKTFKSFNLNWEMMKSFATYFWGLTLCLAVQRQHAIHKIYNITNFISTWKHEQSNTMTCSLDRWFYSRKRNRYNISSHHDVFLTITAQHFFFFFKILLINICIQKGKRDAYI